MYLFIYLLFAWKPVWFWKHRLQVDIIVVRPVKIEHDSGDDNQIKS